MEYEVTTKTIDRQPYVALRTTTRFEAISDVVGPSIGELFSWLGMHGVPPAGGPEVRYLFVGTEECEMEIMAPVVSEVAPAGHILSGVRPAGEVAVTLHVGSYDDMTGAYLAISEWMAANRCVAAGSWWEEYLTSPADEPDPTKWRTLVYAPISRTAEGAC